MLFSQQCGIVLVVFFVAAISAAAAAPADVAEKLADEKSATNAEGSAKEKRGIHFHTYSSPYVYHQPLVVHHAAPIIHHSAPIIHHSAAIYHQPIVATHAYHPVVTSHVISHAPLLAVHHYKRR